MVLTDSDQSGDVTMWLLGPGSLFCISAVHCINRILSIILTLLSLIDMLIFNSI